MTEKTPLERAAEINAWLESPSVCPRCGGPVHRDTVQMRWLCAATPRLGQRACGFHVDDELLDRAGLAPPGGS